MPDNMQPIYVIPENSSRTTGRNAQMNNIQAAKIVADTVKSTLGPKGMDKMLVDSLGGITVTNDGVTILEEMNVEHPSAKMVVEIAKTQEKEIGDGTTTAVILAGEILSNSEALLLQGIHPTTLTKGLRLAKDKAIEKLNSISVKVKNDSDLKKIAMTAMTGKGTEYSKESLSDIIVSAVRQISEGTGDNIQVNLDNIKIEKKVEGSVEDTELVKGIVLDKEKVHPNMPDYISNANIALIDSAFEIRNTEIDAKIEITSPEQMESFLNQEESMLRAMVEKVAKTGANVVVCQKGIDDMAQHFLSRKNIYAIRRVKRSDMEKLSRATSGRIVTNLDDLSEKDLGRAGVVRSNKVGDEMMTFVEGCKNPKAVTILARGGTEHVVSEVKRAIEDALGDVGNVVRHGEVVGGAGSVEMEIAKELSEYADTLSGREQLAVMAFARSMEVIPKILAENAGLDPIDVLTSLRSAHKKAKKWAGIDVFTGEVIDSYSKGIIEPLKIKTQAITSAVEVATMILRIDDVILAGKEQPKDMLEKGDY